MDLISPFLSSRSLSVKLAALKALREFRMNERAIQSLGRALATAGRKPGDAIYKKNLLRTIGIIGKYSPQAAKTVATVLETAFKGEDPREKPKYEEGDKVKKHALYELGRIRTIESVKALVKAASRMRAAPLNPFAADGSFRSTRHPYPYRIHDINNNLNRLAGDAQDKEDKFYGYVRGPLDSGAYYPQIKKWFDRSQKELMTRLHAEKQARMDTYVNAEQ